MEIALAEVKKQLKDAEMKKEEALSNQTKLTIELQNLKINVYNNNCQYLYSSMTDSILTQLAKLRMTQLFRNKSNLSTSITKKKLLDIRKS